MKLLSDFEMNDEFSTNYAKCEEILKLTTSTPSEKTAAWRQQAALLQHMTKNSTAETRYDFLEKHFDKLNSETTENYMQQRVDNVTSMLKGYNLFEKAEEKLEFPEIDDSLFEPRCLGFFTSCCQDEPTEGQLEIFKKAVDDHLKLDEPKEKETKPPVEKPSTSSTNAIGAPKTIYGFLQPTRPIPNVSDIEGVKAEPRRSPENVEKMESSPPVNVACDFRTAREELVIQNAKKLRSNPYNRDEPTLMNFGITKKFLGGRRGVRSNFVTPVASSEATNTSRVVEQRVTVSSNQTATASKPCEDERLANIDPKMVELIRSEIMHKYKPVDWNDIVGLDYAKTIIKEAVVYPLMRPDIFTGLLRPPRGILLFGPPGTGKTLIGKCIASQSQSTFFSITASTVTSKWIGDGEKMVRALFAVASTHQPAVVFIDEIDSLLSKRSESEHESSRRMKNEFLTQLDGTGTSEDDRILIVGATNRPQELDDAARRRLVKRLYIPLPEFEAREQLLVNLLQSVNNDMSKNDLEEIARLADGYSGADIKSLCSEASMAPIREVPMEQLMHIDKNKLRALNIEDFRLALAKIRPSVSADDLEQYLDWNRNYGCSQ